MASYRCQSCGNVISPIPQHCGKDMIVGEVKGAPSLICVNGSDCHTESLPKCCSMPGYTRWI